MKVLLTLIALLALFWLLRASVRRMRAPPPPAGSGDASPRTMLACAQCGLHLPANEALPGRGGVFCGPAHRAAFEEAHPE